MTSPDQPRIVGNLEQSDGLGPEVMADHQWAAAVHRHYDSVPYWE